MTPGAGIGAFDHIRLPADAKSRLREHRNPIGSLRQHAWHRQRDAQVRDCGSTLPGIPVARSSAFPARLPRNRHRHRCRTARRAWRSPPRFVATWKLNALTFQPAASGRRNRRRLRIVCVERRLEILDGNPFSESPSGRRARCSPAARVLRISEMRPAVAQIGGLARRRLGRAAALANADERLRTKAQQ